MTDQSRTFVPALGFRRLTPLYDLVLRLALREATFRRMVVERLDLRDGQRVLDLGCGTGSLALLIKRLHPRVEVVGIDADPDVLAIARSKAAAAGLEVQLVHGSVDAIRLPDATFDRVVSSLVFHHLKRDVKRAATDEAYRVLRDGGSFCLADWGPMPTPLLRAMFLPVRLLDGLERFHDNRDDTLTRLMGEVGFELDPQTARLTTAFGRLSIYRGRKAAATDQ